MNTNLMMEFNNNGTRFRVFNIPMAIQRRLAMVQGISHEDSNLVELRIISGRQTSGGESHRFIINKGELKRVLKSKDSTKFVTTENEESTLFVWSHHIYKGKPLSDWVLFGIDDERVFKINRKYIEYILKI